MGVANKRSIAWATVQSFLKDNFDCIITYQSERYQSTVEKLAQGNDQIIGALPVNVQTKLPELFRSQLPDLLQNRRINAIVHSIACGNLQGSFLQASWEDFAQAQHISAYSLLETARCAIDNADNILATNEGSPSLTTLSYLGAVRAVPNYHIMGPAKASLEAIVRGLAAEQDFLRVNAVSAGPIQTVSARSIPGFSTLYQQTNRKQVTAKQVGDTVHFLSTKGTGINGQTIYVDGGYSTSVHLHPPAEEV
jgi:enoyl-[acyl-carrier protein] reductase I